jgi:hypothetical protein
MAEPPSSEPYRIAAWNESGVFVLPRKNFKNEIDKLEKSVYYVHIDSEMRLLPHSCGSAALRYGCPVCPGGGNEFAPVL